MAVPEGRPSVGTTVASTSKVKVMQWFRTKSKCTVQVEEHPINEKTLPAPPSRKIPLNASTSTINGMISPSVNVHPPTAGPDSLIDTPLNSFDDTWIPQNLRRRSCMIPNYLLIIQPVLKPHTSGVAQVFDWVQWVTGKCEEGQGPCFWWSIC